MEKKQQGRPKKLTEELHTQCYEMAKLGISLESICNMIGVERQTAYNNQSFLYIYKKGNSECGKKVRALLLQKAESDTTANIYLDKVLNKTT
ncbi:MAG: hypothetical protein ACRC6E_13245, partial [Fusobacteriaceae bacterium]